MDPLQLIYQEAPLQIQKFDSFAASFCQSLDSIDGVADENLQNLRAVTKMKASLRDAEDDFVKVLAVKTRKEAQQIAVKDSISATRARIEELKKAVETQRARRDKHATIMSQQSYDGKSHGIAQDADVQEAISWYNKNLGFKVESGRGVKFSFSHINKEKPFEEYTFTIRYENETYTLLNCDPRLKDTQELMNGLNRTNDLFKFVKTMRKKFQEAALLGILPQSSSLLQASTTITPSAPDLSASISGGEHLVKENENSSGRPTKKVHRQKGANQAILSPGSVRCSPRLKRKK